MWDDGLTGPFGLIAEYTLLKVRHLNCVSVTVGFDDRGRVGTKCKLFTRFFSLPRIY